MEPICQCKENIRAQIRAAREARQSWKQLPLQYKHLCGTESQNEMRRLRQESLDRRKEEALIRNKLSSPPSPPVYLFVAMFQVPFQITFLCIVWGGHIRVPCQMEELEAIRQEKLRLEAALRAVVKRPAAVLKRPAAVMKRPSAVKKRAGA